MKKLMVMLAAVGRDGRQNFVCSYNGGVATGHVLTILDKLIGRTNK